MSARKTPPHETTVEASARSVTVMAMLDGLWPRLTAVVDTLPLHTGIRVLEIGCGPGAAARAVARQIGQGYVLGIDSGQTAVRGQRRAPPGDRPAPMIPPTNSRPQRANLGG